MSYYLRDSTAIVTGASRGIGQAVAEMLAAEGARVVLGARSVEALDSVVGRIRAAGGQAVACEVDITCQEHTERLARTAVEAFGGIDIVVANAGRESSALLRKSDPAEWIDTVTTNVIGSYLTVHAALPHMRKHGGQVMFTGSGMGHEKALGRSAYGASKAAVSHLAGILALESWKDNISVNELVPGPVFTDMTSSRWQLGEVPAQLPSERVKPAAEVADFVRSILELGPTGPTGQVFSLARRPW